MTTGDVVYSLRFSLIKILPEPEFDLGSTAGESCVLTARLHMLYDAILQSDIIYGKIQDNNERSTKYLSGERYIYATDEIFPPRPHKAVIDGQHCTIWHRSQSAICLRCRGQGHKTNDTEKCEAYCNSDNIYAFQSGKDVI